MRIRFRYVHITFACVACLWLPLAAPAAPVLDPQPAVNVPSRKTLILPVTATSPEGRVITYTVTSSAPSVIGVAIHTNNPWLKLCVTGFGEMDFQLLRDRAPVTVDHIRSMVQGGFYDGLTFHRVIPFFMIQGGDPLGNGTGGPAFRFDDEFSTNAFFTGDGQLAMANSGDDSNGSQFFITASSPRGLDYDHTIFGQMTRGFAVRDAIIFVPTDANDLPLDPVVIKRATLFSNRTDTVISLTAAPGAAANSTITVVATDSAGAKATNTFTASRVADATVNRPFLGPVTNRFAPLNTQTTISLTAQDIDGAGVEYSFVYGGDDPAPTGGFINSNQFVITPSPGYSGPLNLQFRVRKAGGTGAPYDTQIMTLAVGDAASRVSGTNFTATNGARFTNRVVAFFTNAQPARPVTDFSATINWGDGAVSNALLRARVPGPSFEVVGGHTYHNGGDQRVVVEVVTVLGSTALATSTIVVPPELRVTRVGGVAVPRWPAWAFTYQLQGNTNLITTNWTSITNIPLVVNCENAVSNANVPAQQFFRLRR